MPFEVIIDEQRARAHLHEDLPREFKDALREIFKDLSDDPIKKSAKPVGPPFVPHGRLVERWVDYKSSRHMLRVFFELDLTREQVGVTAITIHPALHRSPLKPPNRDLVGEVTEIPQQ
jgi:hypothetical protein